MDKIMAVISLLFFIVLIVGLIKPSAVLRFTKKKTRGRVFLFYGLPFFLIPFFSGLIKGPPNSPASPPSTQSFSSPQVSEKKEAPRVQEPKGGSILYDLTHEEPPAQPLPPQYASTDFDEYDRYLGINSSLTDMQKDELFNSKVKDSFVKWTGRVVEVDEGPQVQVQHTRGSGIPDVFLYLKPEEKAKALQLKKGQMFTYTGRVKMWGKRSRYWLYEGVILEAH